MKSLSKNLKNRDSGIELLKIFAMFVIIISHIVITLTSTSDYPA